MPKDHTKSPDESVEIAKRRMEEESKPIDLETLLDPMALAKRVQHLEQIVGALVHAARRDGMGGFRAEAFLKDIKIDSNTKRLL